MNIKDIAKYALDKLTEAGAAGGQCIISMGETNELNLDGAEFSLMRTLYSSTLSIKGIVQGKAGSVTVNQLDRDSVDSAVQNCIAAALASNEDAHEGIGDFCGTHNFSEENCYDGERFFDRVKQYLDTIKKDFPFLHIEVNCEHEQEHLLLMNTNGTCLESQNGHYTFSNMFAAKDGTKSSSFNGYGVAFNNLDKPIIDLGMQKTLYCESQRQIETSPVAEKFCGKMVITPPCLSDILGQILAVYATDAPLISGVSPWKDMLGKQVAADCFTLSMQPKNKCIVGGGNFTSDGHLTRDLDIIRGGVLNSFLLSRYAASRTEQVRADTDDSCMVVASGCQSLDELIKGIDKGIVLGRFSGGSPNSAGDFAGVAKNSFLIENGKIGAALSETMISGNLGDMLKNIVGISKETVCDGMTILPYIAVDGIYVK